MKGVVIAGLLVCITLFSAVECATSYTSVYGDSLSSPFQDWSWAAVNKTSNTFTHSGSASISFTAVSYGALYLHATDYISTSAFSGITFWIYRPANASCNIIFNLIVDGSSNSATVTGPTINLATVVAGGCPANVWAQATISFSTFPTGEYDGFWLQDTSGLSTNPAVFVDDISFINAGSATSTLTPVLTTTTSPVTTTSTTKPATTTTKAAITTTTTKSATTTTTKAATTTTTTKAVTTTTTTQPVTTAAPTTTATPSISTTSGGNLNVDPDVLALYNTVTVGDATYYGAYSGGGECMLDPTPDAGKSVAHTVAIANYMLSRTCGMCLKVTGNGQGSGDPNSAVTGTRIVFVNNECPNCPIGNLDFGLNGDGVWNITYIAVPCPISSKIQYVFKGGSSPYWVGLQPRNTIYPVYTFAIKVNGAWTYMPRFSYNYFIASFSNLQFPIQIQMTSVKGEVITDTIASLQNDAIIQGNVQFTP